MHLFRPKSKISEEQTMSSQVGEKRGAVGSGNDMDPTESDFALELKPTPKQTCIPEHQRQRLVSSDTRWDMIKEFYLLIQMFKDVF